MTLKQGDVTLFSNNKEERLIQLKELRTIGLIFHSKKSVE